jgi:hypothetical protein
MAIGIETKRLRLTLAFQSTDHHPSQAKPSTSPPLASAPIRVPSYWKTNLQEASVSPQKLFPPLFFFTNTDIGIGGGDEEKQKSMQVNHLESWNGCS